jgi:hypothetical protein
LYVVVGWRECFWLLLLLLFVELFGESKKKIEGGGRRMAFYMETKEGEGVFFWAYYFFDGVLQQAKSGK